MATRIWQFIKTVFAKEAIAGGVETTNAVLGLAEKLQEEGPKVQQLAPLVTQIDTLLDALNSPLAKLVGSSVPFVPIAIGLLQFYRELTKTEPTLSQSVVLVCQVAYLESFRAEIIKYKSKPEFQAWLKQKGDRPASDAVKRQVKQLAELEIDDREARRALLYFHESEIAKAFNGSIMARLMELGFPQEAASKFAERIARNTDRYLLSALVEAGESVQALVEWYRIGGPGVFEKYYSIDCYLEEKIKPLPLESVFNEPFSFRDIYVPLKAQPLTSDGEEDTSKAPVSLEQWAKEFLNDLTRKDRVMFIQGGPGRGKSVFCRMFADWVRRHELPRWTPILIRLSEIRTLEKDFEEILRQAVDRDFVLTDPGWLTDRNLRFLFLLDGFDELLMQGRTSKGLEDFLGQVGKFQESCASNSEKGHRVIVTGRTLSLQNIEQFMPANLERIEIELMNAELQQQWFAKWEQLAGAAPSYAFQQFLQDERCPARIHGTYGEYGLAQEPLLLYLLAAMHRDGELTIDLFKGAQGADAKILIYQKSIDWVLTKQRPEWLQRKITELEKQGLRRILTEAGLCVVQAGGECAPISMIEQRLTSNSAKALLEQAQQRLGDDPLRNALAAFYLQPGKVQSGSVEFAHKSFGEFLCAERLMEALENWTRDGQRSEFEVEPEQMNWEIYDLLGAPVLTQEIVEYLFTLLRRSATLNVEVLFNRLHKFYRSWCVGEFIDAEPLTLPQKKMRLLREQLRDRDVLLGQRQVDVYTGLNVLILLLELQRYAQDKEELSNRIYFHLCGEEPGTKLFNDLRLSQIISYSDCVGMGAFSNICGTFLSNANLNSADLSNANLNSADLRNANLNNANLNSADLSNANLINADLIFADLNNADLIHADLSNADLRASDLSYADLRVADLIFADLSNANLSDANLRGANLSDANFIEADLIEANLIDANLINTNFSDADLSDANLIDANLTDANLSYANSITTEQLSQAKLCRTKLPEHINLDPNRDCEELGIEPK